MQAGPFRRLAVAVSLSPRREALLAEAGFLAEELRAELLVIHVGKPSEHMQSHLESLMERQHLDGPSCRMVFATGPTAEAIANLCRQEQIDLLIMGAVPSHSIKDTIWGSIAQQTVRKAPCSVLLLSTPSKRPKSPCTIAVGSRADDSHPGPVERALRLAQTLGVGDVHILSRDGVHTAVVDQASGSDPVMAQRRKQVGAGLQEAHSWLQPFEEGTENSDGPQPQVHVKLYAGSAGKAWAEFIHKHRIGLFVLEVPAAVAMGPMWRLTHPYLNHLVGELPTNLLLVR